MTDLSHWDFAVSFTGEEIASLIVGVEPAEVGYSRARLQPVLTRLNGAYQAAIQRCWDHYKKVTFEQDRPKYSGNDLPGSFVRVIDSVWDKDLDYDEVGHELEGLWDRFQEEVFDREDVIRWLADTGLKSEYQFAIGEITESSSSGATTHQKPLETRERNTLLVIIAALCKEAKIDYTKPAKAAGLILGTAAQMGLTIGESTIEAHLKKIPDALETRMK